MKTDPKQSNLPEKLARPARRALSAAGITKLDQLTKYTKKEVENWHGIGPIAFILIKTAFRENGLKFAETSAPKKVV